MNDRLMRRHIDAAVFLRTGQAKHVVILIDGPADGAKTVVTIRQNIGNRKLFQPAGSGCLDDSYKGNIMRSQFVEFNLQLFFRCCMVMPLQDPVSNGLLLPLLSAHLRRSP